MNDSTDLYELVFYPKAAKEFKKLDGDQRIFVLKGLKRIQKEGMLAGQPLHGNLHNCRKLKNKKTGLRIIFMQEDNRINLIEIVAIGYREDSKVYINAGKRINIHRFQK